MAFHYSPNVESLYRAQVTYFEKPLMSNQPYKYKLLRVQSPEDFYLQIADKKNEENEAKLLVLLQGHLNELQGGEKDKKVLVPKLPSELFYEGMPVLVKMKDREALKIKELSRGEVIKIKDGKRQVVDVFLVDQGLVLLNLSWEEDLLPIQLDILRVPKMGISCALGMIIPDGRDTWQTDRDWKKDFLGKESQIVTFLGRNSRSFETVVEVDKVNLGLKYFHEAVAQPIPLNDAQQGGRNRTGRFPVGVYSAWLGLKVCAYGMKVFRDAKDGNKIKCSVQIQPDIVNGVQDKIEEYLKTATDEVKRQPFDKDVGAICLARFGNEYFRSTILKNDGAGTYLVEYVDYKDEQLVAENEMIKLPESLERIQEGAVICQITDLMDADYQDIDKLKGLLENQDLYAVVDACDASIFGSEMLVSLYQPTSQFDGADTPLADLLNLTTSQRPELVQEILQTMECIPEKWSPLFMRPPTLNPKQIYKGIQLSSTGENPGDPWDSVVLRFDDKSDGVGVSELTWFYENGGCDPEVKGAFMQAQNVTGSWVAAKGTGPGELEEGEIGERGKPFWLRAKIIEEGTGGGIKISFVDFGITAWVEKGEVFPLHKYFCKEPFNTVILGRME